MNALSIPYIHYIVFCFLDLKDIINLMCVNKILYRLTKDDQIWRMKYFKKNLFLDQQLYFKYIKMYNLKKSRYICGICEEYMATDIILLLHNCNYYLKKCINCSGNYCSCDNYIMYHKSCLKPYKNIKNLFYCPLCDSIIPGYFIKFNI